MSIKNQKNYLLMGGIVLLMPIYAHAKHEKPVHMVVATINTGINPTEIAITPNGRFAYVVNGNNNVLPGEDSVSVLDLHNNLPSQTITDVSFNGLQSIAINPAGTKAYVTNNSDNGTTVSVIDIATNQVTTTIDGFDGPSYIVINAAGNRAYVSNYGSFVGVGKGNGTTVSVVDLNSNAIIGNPIEVGMAPNVLLLSPNGTSLYVLNYGDGNEGTGSMSIVQTNTDTVFDAINGFSGPSGIVVNGRYAYVTNAGNGTDQIGSSVSVVDLQNRVITESIEVGLQPSDIAISLDRRYLYVTNYNTTMSGEDFTELTAGQGTVSIINTRTNMVVAPTILVGQSPKAIVLSRDGRYAYVSNYTSNTVDVIQLSKCR